MLPLWIIDITEYKTETTRSQDAREDAWETEQDACDITDANNRQCRFFDLLSQIEHVYISDEIKDFFAKLKEKPTPDEKVVEKKDSDIQENAEEDKEEDEKNNDEEKRQALKDFSREGNLWYYSRLKDPFKAVGDDRVIDVRTAQPEEIKDESTKNAKATYQFQKELVEEGQRMIMELRKSNVKPYQPINIVVLGDSTQLLSLRLFPSIAALIQKERGRILQGHIHQGFIITGMLYIPCNANARKTNKREQTLRILQEIEVQHNITSIRGYDHIMYYQNVQNRTDITYRLLTGEQQADYLVQCLVHMFLACNRVHPLLSGQSSDEAFYISLGATSLCFDTQNEDSKDRMAVKDGVLKKFKEAPDIETVSQIQFIDEKLLSPAAFILSSFVENEDPFDFNDVEPNDPNPHPILNFLQKNLKKLYYNTYLRLFPSRLLHKMISAIEERSVPMLELIASTSKNNFKGIEMSIQPAITSVIEKMNKDTGGLVLIEYLLQKLQGTISNNKKQVGTCIEENYWTPLIEDKIKIKWEVLYDKFNEYHNVYQNDLEQNNNGAGCNAMRKEAFDDLVNHLKQESTFLSCITRSVLLGIILVLSITPILDLLSPDFINLGDVHKNAMWWAWGIFMIPLIWQFLRYLLYKRRKRLFIRNLEACYMHDAYARIANRIESEANLFYEKLISLIGEYLDRCKRIRLDVHVSKTDEVPLLFPTSMFNQPLNGGSFGGEIIIPTEDFEDSEIKVNTSPKYVKELNKDDYFMLMHEFKESLTTLFDDVKYFDPHTRKFNDETGLEELVPLKELIEEHKDRWEKVRTNFHTKIDKDIKGNMMPRKYPTICDMLWHYKEKKQMPYILEPMINYAAPNGETTSSADPEFADVKANKNQVEPLTTMYLPLYHTTYQIDPFDIVFSKYLFVTRWRTFEKMSFNRLLPTEDFDEEIKESRIYGYKNQNEITLDVLIEKDKNALFKDILRQEEFKGKKINLLTSSTPESDYYISFKPKDGEENNADKQTYVYIDFADKETAKQEIMEAIRNKLAGINYDDYDNNLYPSSLIMWAMCPDDTSTEWMKLFKAHLFQKAWEARKIYQKELNPKD